MDVGEQETSHYLIQKGPSLLANICVTRPQWIVNYNCFPVINLNIKYIDFTITSFQCWYQSVAFLWFTCHFCGAEFIFCLTKSFAGRYIDIPPKTHQRQYHAISNICYLTGAPISIFLWVSDWLLLTTWLWIIYMEIKQCDMFLFGQADNLATNNLDLIFVIPLSQLMHLIIGRTLSCCCITSISLI